MDLLSMHENVSCAEEARAMYVSEKESGIENYDTQFMYALELLKTKSKEALLTAITLLESGFKRSSQPDRRRECLYLIAIAHTKLGDYEKAIQCCKSLIEVNPEDHQAVELREEIERRTRRDGLTGIAVIGGAALALVGAATAIGVAVSKSKHRKH
uniref:Mitochondria fission 1 protein n=1 Tax=Schistocephalus solidus TaxID=70667 RepID=A0A0X3PC06_SCHSO